MCGFRSVEGAWGLERMISADGGRRTAVLQAERLQAAHRPGESASRAPGKADYCAGCAAQIEGGAILRRGLLYCSFECAAYAAGRVPGAYLG